MVRYLLPGFIVLKGAKRCCILLSISLAIVGLLGSNFGLQAQTYSPYLVRDINHVTQDANPDSFTLVNGILFFAAYDLTHGTELWKSDGTVAGTVLVKDIRSGSGSSFPRALIYYQGRLYFSARGENDVVELWQSDGTEAGTTVVRSVAAGGPERPDNPAIMGNILYFAAQDAINGRELWRSDGTANGTSIVKDIRSGSADASPEHLLSMDTYLLFFADDGVTGVELWKSDGSAAGTQLLKDINTTGSALRGEFETKVVRANNTAYFPAVDANQGFALWKTTGTTLSTVKVKAISPYTSLGAIAFEYFSAVAIGNTLYLRAHDGSSPGCKLWKSNGTSLSTVVVKDICPTSPLVSRGNELFFAGVENNHTDDIELWKSDGTAAGTLRVKDIVPGQNGSYPSRLNTVGNTVFFFAFDPVSGREVWKSDGTEGGTLLVKDIHEGSNSSLPSRITSFFDYNGISLFAADDGSTGAELWRSDGTAGGTYQVRDVNDVETWGSYPHFAAATNDYFYFHAYDGHGEYELWRTDGTSNGTQSVKSLSTASPWSGLQYLATVGADLYATTDNPGILAQELWYRNGNTGNVTKVATFSNSVTFLTAKAIVGNHLLFTVHTLSDQELWLTDGTPEGTTSVVSLAAAQVATSNGVPTFFIYNNALWKSDGSAVGTQPVKGGLNGSLLVVDNEVYVITENGLWKSDGTELGTARSTTLPTQSFAYRGYTFYFASNAGGLGYELWQSDGTQAEATLVKDINPGAADAEVRHLTFVDNALFFTADDGVHGTELWKSDGTTAGTVMVKDILPGSESSYPGWLTELHGKLYFFANSTDKTLWVSDGTETGTQPIMAINLKTSDFEVDPELALQAHKNQLYFTHNDGTTDIELWSIQVTPDPIYTPAATPTRRPTATPTPTALVTPTPTATWTPMPTMTPTPPVDPLPTGGVLPAPGTPTPTKTVAPAPLNTATPTPTPTLPAQSAPLKQRVYLPMVGR